MGLISFCKKEKKIKIKTKLFENKKKLEWKLKYIIIILIWCKKKKFWYLTKIGLFFDDKDKRSFFPKSKILTCNGYFRLFKLKFPLKHIFDKLLFLPLRKFWIG